MYSFTFLVGLECLSRKSNPVEFTRLDVVNILVSSTLVAFHMKQPLFWSIFKLFCSNVIPFEMTRTKGQFPGRCLGDVLNGKQ